MTPSSDTGIAGDQNTNVTQPQFIGQVYVPFPGSVAGDQVCVEFSGDNGGTTTLAVGGGGRGYSGTYDVLTTTDSTGTFTVTAPPLPEGFQYAVAVVVGQPDQPPLPGYSLVAHRRLPHRQDARPRSRPRRSRRAAPRCPCPTAGSRTPPTSPA